MPAPTKFHIKGVRTPVSLVDADGEVVPLLFDGAIWRLPVDAAVTFPALATVSINDALGGTTEVSVKIDGVARSDGSFLIGGEDPGGLQRALALDVLGAAHVTDVNGALLGSTFLANTEETAELANTDIFAADAAVARDGWIDLEFYGSLAGIWSMKLIRTATTIVKAVNNGDSIDPDEWQTFSFPVKAGDAINIRVDAAMTVTAGVSFRDR